MYQDNKGANYNWFDRIIAEQFVVGGTSIGLHKYLGPIVDPVPSGDATKPTYTTENVFNIQDLLFLENRDRKYDTDVYVMRGHYQRSDNDFDLSQFGLFLQTGTIVMTFHYNDMMRTLGRKIMAGDVIELFHLKDSDVLNVDAALKRFYVVGDCSFATEGFSPTWYPHLWRAKLDPLVDSQEYKDILDQIKTTNSAGPKGTNTATGNLGDIVSTYQTYIDVNEAIILQAEAELPKSGYDIEKLYSLGLDVNNELLRAQLTADNRTDTSDNNQMTSDSVSYSPGPKQNPKGYLVGDGMAPNDLPVTAGVAFPVDANQGDYCLRLDYLPNRLFRFDGRRWIKIEDNVRTNITPGDPNNKTLRNGFVNNANTMELNNGTVVTELQNLNEALRPKKNY